MRNFKNEQEVSDYHKESGKAIIIFEGTIYDVTDYMPNHPGGADLVEQYLGKCIDQAFEENNHSNQARLLFRDLDKVGYIIGDEAHAGKDAPNIKGLDGYQLQSKLKFDFTKGLYKQMVECNL